MTRRDGGEGGKLELELERADTETHAIFWAVLEKRVNKGRKIRDIIGIYIIFSRITNPAVTTISNDIYPFMAWG